MKTLKDAAIGKGSRRPHSRLLPPRAAAFAAAASSFVRDAGLRLQLHLEKNGHTMNTAMVTIDEISGGLTLLLSGMHFSRCARMCLP